ncbi:putative metal-dependent hydrolase [Hymenobacter sp. UV11]|uniref:YfiT family bacillithiol transferase n=1 Tax=Hymenobacter sp. UV11 TaxID=1849735 RepID=UPI00105CC210|nr:putative metal-dependent hydrolase [Hymenobacter sp. UV11]TDN37885.1 metal-dependent hydrolase [Hymenobacter sp. UV11]TFZ65096.1 putative metal-dependent hydrolase [Hymenobacter sp. UV11]
MTTTLPDELLRFPIGRAQLPPTPLTPAGRAPYLQQLAELPGQVRAAAQAAGPRLEQPYRPGGWTGRQVIHHLADTHLNLYARFRLALTEDNPTVRPFDEAAWAELPDVAITPIEVSLSLLESLHARWVSLLQQLTPDQWQRTFYHPRYDTTLTLDQALVQYAWHGQHHLAHLLGLGER